jgi:lysophospholipase L1-like esterase
MKFWPFAVALACAIPTFAQAIDTPSSAPPLNAMEAPPLSPQCEVPNADIALPAPLPRLAVQIERQTPGSTPNPVKIMAFGSSSTAGIGASSIRRSYPVQLQEILQKALRGVDARIVNRGVSGELAVATAKRIRDEVAIEKPDVILWQVGTNDAITGVPPEEFRETVRSTIVWLKQSNIDVVLVGLQYTPTSARNERYFAIRSVLRGIATTENILYVRRFDAMQYIVTHAHTELVTSDNLHLNDLGYRCMAEHVARGVIASLFLKKKDVAKRTPSIILTGTRP